MRRILWLALGLGAGATGAVMTARFLRKQSRKVAPATLAREARGGIMDIAKLFSESIAEGKEAMRAKEEELRDSGLAGGERPSASAARTTGRTEDAP